VYSRLGQFELLTRPLKEMKFAKETEETWLQRLPFEFLGLMIVSLKS